MGPRRPRSATSGPTGCTSVWIPRCCDSTSTSTASRTHGRSSGSGWEWTSSRATYRPYGQVLAGVLGGDPTLSVRGDQAVQTWRIMEPVLRAWRDDAVPLQEYEAGSDGPTTVPKDRVTSAPGGSR